MTRQSDGLVVHQCDSRSLEPDKKGLFNARCVCGWRFGLLPDLETVCDVLMAHAYQEGRQ